MPDVKFYKRFLTAISKFRDDAYQHFANHKVLEDSVKDKLFAYVGFLENEVDPKDSINQEFKVIRETSSTDNEFLRNVDYLVRLCEEVISDLSDDGKSVWLNVSTGMSKKSRVSTAFPKPKFVEGDFEKLWERAVSNVEEVQSLVLEDGEYDVAAVLAEYITLLEEEEGKSQKLLDKVSYE